MIIVAGHLLVEAMDRPDYLRGCEQVVRLARTADGCLDFAISPDLLDPERINIHERWASRPQLEAFRGSGPDEGQTAAMKSATVEEYDVSG